MAAPSLEIVFLLILDTRVVLGKGTQVEQEIFYKATVALSLLPGRPRNNILFFLKKGVDFG